NGVAVIEAADGNTALELFRASAEAISVVLLDSTLPGMNGAEVFAEMRRIQPAVKVICTSAFAREPMFASEAWAFIRKPYPLTDLRNLAGGASREPSRTYGAVTRGAPAARAACCRPGRAVISPSAASSSARPQSAYTRAPRTCAGSRPRAGDPAARRWR